MVHELDPERDYWPAARIHRTATAMILIIPDWGDAHLWDVGTASSRSSGTARRSTAFAANSVSSLSRTELFTVIPHLPIEIYKLCDGTTTSAAASAIPRS